MKKATKCRSYRVKVTSKGGAWLLLASQLLLVRTGAVFTPPRNLVDLMSMDPYMIAKLTSSLLKSLYGDVPHCIKQDAIQDMHLHLLSTSSSGQTPLETFKLSRAHNHPRILWFSHLSQIFKSRLSNFMKKAMPSKMSGALSIQTTSEMVPEPGSKILPESCIRATYRNGEEHVLHLEREYLGGQRLLRFKTFVLEHLPHPTIVTAMDLFLQDHDSKEVCSELGLDDSEFRALCSMMKDLFTVFIADEYQASLV